MLIEQFSLYTEAFLRLIYPSQCGACNLTLDLNENAVCKTCGTRLRQMRLSYEDAVFTETLESLDDAWSLFPYEDPVKELLTGIKFYGKRWLIQAFEESLAEMTLALSSEYHYDFMIPIPLSRLKRLEREFNQSDLIAERVSRASGIPVNRSVLKKYHTAMPQSALGHHERIANPFGAFTLKNPDTVKNKSVLLIDDIVTTGSTANEAARILKKEGARRVDLLTLARTELHS